MKERTLKRQKWILGGISLFLLYTALHSGGILSRLGLLVGATACFALWSRSKQQLDLLGREAKAVLQTVELRAAVPDVQEAMEPVPYFAKMPVRYPRPVYIHRSGFELQRH